MTVWKSINAGTQNAGIICLPVQVFMFTSYNPIGTRTYDCIPLMILMIDDMTGPIFERLIESCSATDSD